MSEEKRVDQENRKENATQEVEYMKSEMAGMIAGIKTPSVIARCYQYIKYIYLHND